MKIGASTVTALFLGSTAITSAYLGTTQVFGGAEFSPSSLFAASEPGVWYDPSDLTTLFQDTAGTTPVTTPGQTVALMLDKSKGLTLGSELVTNGGPDFVSSTGWSLLNDTTVNVVSGDFEVVRGSGTGQIAQSFVTVVGKTYKISATVRRGTAASFTVSAGNGETGSSIYTSGARTDTAYTDIVAYFAAASTTTWVRILIGGTAVGSTVFADNISVKELPGFHATQATAASRPTYGVVPLGGQRNILLATDTMATQTRAVTAAAHTLAFTGTGTVTLTGVSTDGPLVGTGVSNRVSLTFTPTAGNLTLTVSGSVTLAQLELGSTATAYQRVSTAFDVTEAGVQSLSYLFDDLVGDTINWTAPAGTYTVAWVDTAGNVTIQTGQSLSGTTDALKAQRMAGYLAINRALTGTETTNLTAWLAAKGGA